MKMKTILTTLVLGTAVLVVDANIGHADQSAKSPGLNNYQTPSSQASAWDGNNDGPNVATPTPIAPVPEANEIIAVALLLVPLGVSTVRTLRRNKKVADQTN